MTINIYESNMTRRTLIAQEPTFAEAKARVERMGVAFMEDDSEYVDCADAYTNDGRIIAIQPDGFTLKDARKWAQENVPAMKAMAKERADAMTAFDKEFGL